MLVSSTYSIPYCTTKKKKTVLEILWYVVYLDSADVDSYSGDLLCLQAFYSVKYVAADINSKCVK